MPTLASIKSARTSILADNAEKIPSRREEARGPAVIPRNIRGTANLRARKAMRPEIASEERIEPPKTILTTNLGLTSYASNIAVHKTRLVPSTDQKNIDENSIEYNAFDRLPGEARFRR